MRSTNQRRVQEAFERLTSNGVDREKLLNGLINLSAAMHHCQKFSKQRKMWKTQCGTPTGMTWSQFQRCPQRYRDLAREIENVNNSPYYSPDRWFGSRSVRTGTTGRDLVAHLQVAKMSADVSALRDKFLDLPTTLRAYAHFLTIVLEGVREAFYTVQRQPAVQPKRIQGELAELVQNTGRSRKRMEDLATLLAAADRLDEDAESGAAINPETLRRYVNRNKRRRLIQTSQPR